MAGRYCKHCGREITPGKHFCTGCGKQIPAPAGAPLNPVAAPEPGAALCAQCGSFLIPGKRFCRRCGCRVAEAGLSREPAHTIPPVVVEPVAPFAEKTPRAGFFSVAFGDEKTAEQSEAAPVAESAPAPVHDAAQPPAVQVMFPQASAPIAAEPAPAPVFAMPFSEPQHHSRSRLGVGLGIAAFVLLAASGWTWYAHMHRSNAPLVSLSQPATAPTEIVTPTLAPNQTPKPAGGNPLATAASAPQIAAQHTTRHPVPPASARQPDRPQLFIQIPAPAITSVPARSGVLHYQGPPVPYNGEVIFDHLPNARLRFMFDHQAWSLTIRPNPDGTKKVTLTSQKPGYQTICDLTWAAVN